MEILLTILTVSVLFLIILVLRSYFTKPPADDGGVLLVMQQQVESLRSDLRSSLQHITENVNQQLNLVVHQLQNQTSNVGSRLDTATKVIGDVQRNLGELTKATDEIKELGQSVSKLEEILRAPKLRGGLGEFLLEDLLKQVLPTDHFQMQYRFRNGQIVDAIIRTSDHLAPIDSKFPLENFRRIVTCESDGERKSFQKLFTADVKKHIDDIAAKYICPDEGTFPFALMYIPAENIYYEVIIKDEASNGISLYHYALERKVIPVSPNSFYAYLQVIALGLRGLSIEQSAREILNNLTRLQQDVVKVREAFDVLGTHIDNSAKKYEEANRRLTAFEGRLEQIAQETTKTSLPASTLEVTINSNEKLLN